MWALGTGVAIASLLFGLWWKVEMRQDKKIDDYHKTNMDEHRHMRDQIDEHHKSLIERIESLWKHLITKD